MKKSIIITLALMLVTSMSVFAQDKAVVKESKKVDRVMQQVDNLKSTLNLDAVQIEKVTAIYKDSEAKLEALKVKLLSLREAKGTLDTSDKKATEKFNADYNSAMTDRKTIMEDRKTAISAVLSDEQKAKFETKAKAPASPKKVMKGK